MSEGPKFQIPQLCDSNYAAWSDNMVSLLQIKGYRDMLDRMPVNEEEEERSAVALSYMRIYMSDRWKRRIASHVTAISAWDAVRAEHVAALAPMASSLHTRFFASRMTDSQTIDEYIDEVERIEEDLGRIGQTLPTAVVLSHILATLKPSLAAVAAHLITDQSRLTMSGMRASLRALSDMQAPEQHLAHSAVPLNPPGKVRHPQRAHAPAERPFKGSCYFCHQVGHVKSMCPAWRRAFPVEQDGVDNAAPAPVRAMVAAVVATDKTPGDGSYIPVALKPSEWLFDTGATAHICQDVELFDKYGAFDTPQAVTMMDGAHCYALGSGEIILQGRMGPVTLHDVLYVPTVRHHLISLSLLCMEGTATFNSYGIVVTIGGCVLFGTLHDGLYWLELNDQPPDWFPNDVQAVTPPTAAAEEPTRCTSSAGGEELTVGAVLEGTASSAPLARPQGSVTLTSSHCAPGAVEPRLPVSLPAICAFARAPPKPATGLASTSRTPIAAPPVPVTRSAGALTADGFCRDEHFTESDEIALWTFSKILPDAVVTREPIELACIRLRVLAVAAVLQECLWEEHSFACVIDVDVDSDVRKHLAPLFSPSCTLGNLDKAKLKLSADPDDWAAAIRSVMDLNGFAVSGHEPMLFQREGPPLKIIYLFDGTDFEQEKTGDWSLIRLDDFTSRSLARAREYLYGKVVIHKHHGEAKRSLELEGAVTRKRQAVSSLPILGGGTRLLSPYSYDEQDMTAPETLLASSSGRRHSG